MKSVYQSSSKNIIMNVQVVSALIAIYVTQIDAVTYANERGVLARQAETCDTVPQLKCSSDCSSVLFCYSAINPPVRILCEANEPYCVNGACSSVQGTCTTGPTLSDFNCTSAGYFPDPTNCTQYHVCTEEGVFSILQRCPTGLIYNSNLVRCEIGQPRVDHAFKKICKSISCDKRIGFIVFPANPAYYVNCSNDEGVQSMTIYKCNDVINEVYDISLGTCIFKCKSKGYFADPLDCSYYYVCSGWIKYTPIRVSCPTGLYFNGSVCDVSTTQCHPGSISTTNLPLSPPTVVTTQSPSATPPTASSTQNPSTTPTAPINIPPLQISVDPLNTLLSEQITESTTKSPIFPFYSLWKHKGKYSVRLGKFLRLL